MVNLDKYTGEELVELRDAVALQLEREQAVQTLIRSFSEASGFPHAMFELFNAVEDGVTILDADLRILWMNPKAIEQALAVSPGATLNTLIGAHCWEATQSGSPCGECPCQESMDARKSMRKVGFIGHGLKDHSKKFDLWAIPVYNGMASCIMLVRETTSSDDG